MVRASTQSFAVQVSEVFRNVSVAVMESSPGDKERCSQSAWRTRGLENASARLPSGTRLVEGREWQKSQLARGTDAGGVGPVQ